MTVPIGVVHDAFSVSRSFPAERSVIFMAKLILEADRIRKTYGDRTVLNID